MFKLRDWINADFLETPISENPRDIQCLEKPDLEANPDQMDWSALSYKPSAIRLLEQNLDKINWMALACNPAAIHILEANPKKIYWNNLSGNPAAMHLLQANPKKINWFKFSKNPAIFEYDYKKMKETTGVFVEELMANRFHPKNMDKFEYWNHD